VRRCRADAQAGVAFVSRSVLFPPAMLIADQRGDLYVLFFSDESATFPDGQHRAVTRTDRSSGRWKWCHRGVSSASPINNELGAST
jgi:hypothetical protein